MTAPTIYLVRACDYDEAAAAQMQDYCDAVAAGELCEGVYTADGHVLFIFDDGTFDLVSRTQGERDEVNR